MKITRRMLLASGASMSLYLGSQAKAADRPKSDVPEGAVILTAVVKAKAGQEEAVREALLSMVQPTRQEPGCLAYNLHQSKKDPTQFMFYEQWASQAALDAHGQTPHMKALGGKLKGRTDQGGGVTLYDLLQ